MSGNTQASAGPGQAGGVATAAPRLGRLQRVDFATVDSAGLGGVASWLSTDPAALGEALRLDIRPTENDDPDVVGELTAGVPVVVKAHSADASEENVGALAALVAQIDAAVVALVAPSVSDAVRDRLKKLNRNTSKLIVFFAVELELWQIDDSAPAPLFRVVVGPEGWDSAPPGAVVGPAAAAEAPQTSAPAGGDTKADDSRTMLQTQPPTRGG